MFKKEKYNIPILNLELDNIKNLNKNNKLSNN